MVRAMGVEKHQGKECVDACDVWQVAGRVQYEERVKILIGWIYLGLIEQHVISFNGS